MSYGWSGLRADGARVFALGATVENTALTGVQIYAAEGDFTSAWQAWEQSLLTFASLQAVQVNSLNKACAASITGGFASSALGTPHTYPSKDTDQTNMLANASTGGQLWCQDTSGAWAMVAHTADQAKAALTDFVAMRDAARQQLAGLTGQVTAATTIAAVQAIGWS